VEVSAKQALRIPLNGKGSGKIYVAHFAI